MLLQNLSINGPAEVKKATPAIRKKNFIEYSLEKASWCQKLQDRD